MREASPKKKKKTHAVLFHLYNISMVAKSVEPESGCHCSRTEENEE